MISNISVIAQLVVSVSIIIVWVFRFDNIVKEFHQYGLSDLTRSIGIWYPSLVLVPILLMAFLMLSAQYFHFKVNNSWQKRVPSSFLLLLCLFVAAVSLNLIA
jgi:uncharacterized oligopeptide transporter (OPT) family protein